MKWSLGNVGLPIDVSRKYTCEFYDHRNNLLRKFYQKKRAKRKDTSDEKFLTAVVNFLIMALIVFCIVKAMNAAGERFGHKEEKEPDTKECPYCKSKIAIA